MFRSERVLRIICFETVFLAFNPGGCPQSHTGQGFSSCVFSCQHAKKSIVLGHFSFQFELWFFLIWSWSIPVGASKIRCSTRVFAVSKTAATDHSRHECTKCEQDSKSVCEQSHMGSNPILSAKKSSKLKGFLDFPFFLARRCSCGKCGKSSLFSAVFCTFVRTGNVRKALYIKAFRGCLDFFARTVLTSPDFWCPEAQEHCP